MCVRQPAGLRTAVPAGFTAWGSFAEYVALDFADTNLVRLPDELDCATAASLGCRFVTSFRAIVDRGRVRPGEWVAVHGCGGVGLSAIMIATAMGANVVAIDLTPEKLDFAKEIGAVATVNASEDANVVQAVQQITNGGAHVSIDALGHPVTCFNSISNLRRRGRHVQVGLMLGEHSQAKVPMAQDHRPRIADPGQPWHAGVPLRGDDGHDRDWKAQAAEARRQADRVRRGARSLDGHGQVRGHRDHCNHQLLSKLTFTGVH